MFDCKGQNSCRTSTVIAVIIRAHDSVFFLQVKITGFSQIIKMEMSLIQNNSTANYSWVIGTTEDPNFRYWYDYYTRQGELLKKIRISHIPLHWTGRERTKPEFDCTETLSTDVLWCVSSRASCC